MPRTLALPPRFERLGRSLTAAQAIGLIVPAAIGSCALVLAVAAASSRGVGLFYGVAVILLAGLAVTRRDTGRSPRELPRWFLLQHPMSVPLAMLFFALALPLFR
ncbi:hypothetical protein IP88_10400 [alpha proteobacterium AAP81b]|nr:hypothetical protein IP88_10400 [alpha proteobacterium AAP81b]